MGFNWLDFILLAILIITFILGIVKGFIRQIIGIAAVVVGLVLAVYNYPYVSQFYSRLVSHQALSRLLGFFTVFIAVMCLGWLIASLLSKLAKGPLKFLNHTLGGFLGFLKGILISGVIVFALLVFPVEKSALKGSQLSPYCLKITKAIYYLIPESLKQDFRKAYQDILEKGKKDGKKV